MNTILFEPMQFIILLFLFVISADLKTMNLENRLTQDRDLA